MEDCCVRQYCALRNTSFDRMETKIVVINRDSHNSVKAESSQPNAKFGWQEVRWELIQKGCVPYVVEFYRDFKGDDLRGVSVI